MDPEIFEALRPLVTHLPPEEQEPAARRVLRYLELVIEQVDEEDGLTAGDEGSTLSYSV
jgi:uncharacterized protein YaeQ